MSEDRRVYFPVDPASTDLMVAVVIPIAIEDEALVVELFKSGNVRSAWGERDMSDRLYLAGGMRRDDAAAVPPEVEAVIERRYPERLTWPEHP